MNAEQPLRIGAVSYLNTKPLVFTLAERAPWATVEYDLPSRLADRLAARQLEVALIPSYEFFQHPEYELVSDACIGCRGAVWSVKLLMRRPAREIRTLALDEGSRTSAALARVLLYQRFGIRPQLESLPLGREARDTTADAVLLIGDRAMHATDEAFCEVWDLGLEWQRQFNLPFVFAMWAARPGFDTRPVAKALSAARDAGVAHLASIAAECAAGVGLTPADALRYLHDNLHFYLAAAERESLNVFRNLAAEALRDSPRVFCGV